MFADPGICLLPGWFFYKIRLVLKKAHNVTRIAVW